MKSIKYIIRISIFLFVTLFHSCEKEIPLEIDNIEQKIVLNSLFYADSIINVSLSKTVGFNSNQDINMISNAEVNLFTNGEFTETLQELNEGEYQTSQPIIAGLHYSIRANTSSGNVSASSSLPDTAIILEVDSIQTSNIIMDSWIGPEMIYKITFKIIDSAEENFYLIKLLTKDTLLGDNQYQEDLFYLGTDYMNTSTDIDTETFITTYPYLRLPDIDFEMGENTYAFGFRPNSFNSSNLYYLEIYSLDKSFYKYLETLEIYEAIQFDYFAEPINLYSNVLGGIGIFAGASCSKIVVPPVSDGWY